MLFQIHTNSASSTSELLSSCWVNTLLMPYSRQQCRKISTCLEPAHADASVSLLMFLMLQWYGQKRWKERKP